MTDEIAVDTNKQIKTIEGLLLVSSILYAMGTVATGIFSVVLLVALKTAPEISNVFGLMFSGFIGYGLLTYFTITWLRRLHALRDQSDT